VGKIAEKRVSRSVFLTILLTKHALLQTVLLQTVFLAISPTGKVSFKNYVFYIIFTPDISLNVMCLYILMIRKSFLWVLSAERDL